MSLADFEQWLTRPVAIEDAIDRIEREERAIESARKTAQSPRGRIAKLLTLLSTSRSSPQTQTCADAFRQWISAHDVTNVVLWEYDSGDASWENLCGECGYVLIRDRQIVDAWMYCEN